MLFQTISAARSGSETAANELITQFSPLLHRYARDLHTEDAYEDMRCDFWEIITSMPLDRMKDTSDFALLGYFKKAVRTRFIKRLNRITAAKGTLPYSDLMDSEKYKLECRTARWDDYSRGFFHNIRHLLNEKEFSVIVSLYYDDISVPELADSMGVSRQNINQIKNRALAKLRRMLASDISE